MTPLAALRDFMMRVRCAVELIWIKYGVQGTNPVPGKSGSGRQCHPICYSDIVEHSGAAVILLL